MNVQRTAVAIALVVVLLAGTGHAQDRPQDIDVGGLLEACTSPHGSAARAFCGGYLRGLSEAMTTNTILGFSEFGICDAPLDLSEIEAVFVDWANRHPQDSRQSIGFGVVQALIEAYRCR